MGFELKVRVTEKSDASLLHIYDASGIYSANGNLTGYQNATTVFLANVTAASITVYITDTTTLLPSTNAVTIDVFPTLPNVVNTPYEVTALALGYTDGVIPDGMIEVEYSITTTVAGLDTVYETSVKKINYALVCCCVRALAGRLDSCGCECEDEATQTYLSAWAALKGLGRMVRDCKQPNRAIETLKSLQQTCRNEKCLSCH